MLPVHKLANRLVLQSERTNTRSGSPSCYLQFAEEDDDGAVTKTTVSRGSTRIVALLLLLLAHILWRPAAPLRARLHHDDDDDDDYFQFHSGPPGMVLVELSFRGTVFVELRIWGCVRACEGDGAIAYRCVF